MSKIRSFLEFLVRSICKYDEIKINRKYNQNEVITKEDLISFYSAKAVLCLQKSERYSQKTRYSLDEIDPSNEIFANVYYNEAKRSFRKARSAKAREILLVGEKNEH